MEQNNHEGFVTFSEKDASSEIKSNLLSFGEDVIQTKFTSYLDGCKHIIRRIIWFTKDFGEVKGFIKLMGEIGEAHTGGDSSIYGAVIRLGQPFAQGHPIITIEGNFGTYYDPDGAAAPRYLQAKLSDFAKDIFFNGINLRTLPMIPTKDFSNEEPKYLIPKIPMALVMGNTTVGFGFKSHIPMIDFTDVCDAVMTFSQHYQNKGVGIPSHRSLDKYLLPSFPIKNLIKNRKELLRAYANGQYDCPVLLDGWVDLSGNQIIVRTVPYGVDLSTVTNNLRELMKDKKHWILDYIDSANQYSSDETEFTITIKRGKNPFEVLDKLRPILRYSLRWTPLYNYLKDDRAVSLDPASLIYFWYQERLISIAGGLKYRQSKLIYDKLKLEAILTVLEHGDEAIEIIKNADTTEDAINKLHARFTKLTWKQAEILANVSLSQFAKKNKSILESELEQTDSDLEATVTDFSRKDEIIFNDAQYLKKKYRSTKKSLYSDDFIGYVQFGNLGVINFFDKEDMKEILATKGWNSSIEKSIHLYDPRLPNRFIVKSNRLIPLESMAREITCDDLICFAANTSNEITLVVSKDETTAAVIEKAVNISPEGFNLYPISRQFYALHRRGNITKEDICNLSVRKSVTHGARSDIIFGMPDTMHDVVLFYMNTSNPNILRMDRILDTDTLPHLKLVPTGKIKILGVYPVKTNEIFLNIPADCRKLLTMEHLIVTKMHELFKQSDQKYYEINLGKSVTDFGVKLKRDNEVRTLYELNCGA